MTRDEIKSRIPILQAWLDGAAIEFRHMDNGSIISSWRNYDVEDMNAQPDIFANHLQWRVKPTETKPREWWLVLGKPYDLVFDSERFARAEVPSAEKLIHVREVLTQHPPATASSPPH